MQEELSDALWMSDKGPLSHYPCDQWTSIDNSIHGRVNFQIHCDITIDNKISQKQGSPKYEQLSFII